MSFPIRKIGMLKMPKIAMLSTQSDALEQLVVLALQLGVGILSFGKLQADL